MKRTIILLHKLTISYANMCSIDMISELIYILMNRSNPYFNSFIYRLICSYIEYFHLHRYENYKLNYLRLYVIYNNFASNILMHVVYSDACLFNIRSDIFSPVYVAHSYTA